jgi:hypothetical protein
MVGTLANAGADIFEKLYKHPIGTGMGLKHFYRIKYRITGILVIFYSRFGVKFKMANCKLRAGTTVPVPADPSRYRYQSN